MKFFFGMVIGFIGGVFYALYQTIEAPNGTAIELMRGIKAILEVL